MNIEATISSDSGAKLRRALGPILRAKVEAIGEDMVKTANLEMAGKFNLQRDYERRRSPGSVRAANALDFAVKENPDGGYEVDFRVLGGEDVLRRIIIMNYGSKDHDIEPSGDWEIGGLNPKKVSRTATAANRRASSGAHLAYPSRDGGYWQGADGQSVHHPGTTGQHFLEAGRDAAAQVHIH